MIARFTLISGPTTAKEGQVSFPAGLTSVLTGVTPAQLAGWRRTGLLVPEVSATRPPLYSFRDLLALRTVARLRSETSLQKVRTAFSNMPEFDLKEHLSRYQFATDGKTIAVQTDDGFLDMVANPGQFNLYSIDDILRPFQNRRGDDVVDFEHPRRHLLVDPDRLGGWPTVEGTRVGFDTVAQVMRGDDIPIDRISRYYPGVSPAAAFDALSLAKDVAERSAS